MKPSWAVLVLVVGLSHLASAGAASPYETINYHVQQMIAQAVSSDSTGVQAFREQLENLPRPKAGDSAKARPLQQRGLEQLARNALKEALAAFRQAFIADPTDPEIASQLARTYLRLERFKEAERLSIYTLSLAPTHAITWLGLGEIYGQIGDASRAGGAFANAYRFASDPPQLTERLRQLATIHPTEAVRASAQQALQTIKTAITPQPSAAPVLAPKTSPTTSAVPPAPTIADTAATATRPTEPFPNNAIPLSAPSTSTQEPNTTNPGQRIYRQSIPHTCLIVTSRNGKTDNLGSGLLVSADGLVITNDHVIEKADNLAVKCGERESTASVRKRSKQPDLALLATSLKNGESFIFNEAYSQDLIGRDVFVIGNPYGLEGTFSTGVISGLREIDGVRYIQISAPISPGNSGGPVILQDGTVIGIAAMVLKKGQNLNFAIASSEVIASGLFDPARMQSRPLVKEP